MNAALKAYYTKYKKEITDEHIEIIKSSLKVFEDKLIESINKSTRPIFFVNIKIPAEIELNYNRDVSLRVIEKILPSYVPEGFILDSITIGNFYRITTMHAKILLKENF